MLTGGGRCEGLEKWSCLVGPGLLSPPSCWIPIQPVRLLVTAQLSCPWEPSFPSCIPVRECSSRIKEHFKNIRSALMAPKNW